jgi:hypothetical protein
MPPGPRPSSESNESNAPDLGCDFALELMAARKALLVAAAVALVRRHVADARWRG